MSEHIFILDDDVSTLEMLRLVLEGEGNYQVTIARTLVEDLTEIERLCPDLILLDFKFGVLTRFQRDGDEKPGQIKASETEGISHLQFSSQWTWMSCGCCVQKEAPLPSFSPPQNAGS